MISRSFFRFWHDTLLVWHSTFVQNAKFFHDISIGRSSSLCCYLSLPPLFATVRCRVGFRSFHLCVSDPFNGPLILRPLQINPLFFDDEKQWEKNFAAHFNNKGDILITQRPRERFAKELLSQKKRYIQRTRNNSLPVAICEVKDGSTSESQGHQKPFAER